VLHGGGGSAREKKKKGGTESANETHRNTDGMGEVRQYQEKFADGNRASSQRAQRVAKGHKVQQVPRAAEAHAARPTHNKHSPFPGNDYVSDGMNKPHFKCNLGIIFCQRVY